MLASLEEHWKKNGTRWQFCDRTVAVVPDETDFVSRRNVIRVRSAQSVIDSGRFTVLPNLEDRLKGNRHLVLK